ncbi:MAG: AAA family ATPase, partial [Firmicutes bacterium]|nr:AAA family ATPase [Bacillota bacterium]
MNVTPAKAPRVMIAGTGSGCGKTTMVCALLQALVDRGYDTASFKCGPDYIDPMFHSQIIGTDSQNVDLFFSTEEEAKALFARHAKACNVIEGVMGYYDGIGTEGRASTFDVARATETPVVLVIKVRGMYTSAGAVIRGFKDFRPDSRIEGVIFNGASAMLYKDLKAIAENAGVKAYGFLPKMPEAELGSRHLGLITAEEIEDLRERIDKLAEKAEECVDIDGLIELANTAPRMEGGKLFTGEPVYATVCRGNFCGLKRPV